MRSTDDSTLLRQYAESNSDDAFATLVTRHINLVYSVALRHVSNPHHAEEITQAVFIILAKKAAGLRHDNALSSWLFQATHFTANNFVRSEMRRHHREQEAHMQSILNEPEPEIWTKISPLLDTAVAGLNEKDRRCIVLRFYEGRNLREVGAALGASEDAAKKRVARALEKLRKFFVKRGVVSTTAIIAGVVSANSVQAAPSALAKSISAVAITKGAAASGSTLTLVKGALKLMAWSKTKTTIIATAGILLLGGGITTVVLKVKASADRAARDKDPVAYAFRNPSHADANKVREQLVGNWALESKRLGVNKDYRHYKDNNFQKMWTLTNWAINFYDARSNLICSASGPYELQGDHYTETIEKGTGVMTNYIGTQAQFRLRVDGDKYYQTALGDKPGLQEIGHRLSQ